MRALGQLQERHAQRQTLQITEEYDVQALLHFLLPIGQPIVSCCRKALIEGCAVNTTLPFVVRAKARQQSRRSYPHGRRRSRWRREGQCRPASAVPTRAFQPTRDSRIPRKPACHPTGTGRCASSGRPKRRWIAARRYTPRANWADDGSLRPPAAAYVLSGITPRRHIAPRKGHPGPVVLSVPASYRPAVACKC